MKLNIRKIREELFLTQENFAKALGITKKTVSTWEKDWFEPSLTNKRKIVELCKENGLNYKDFSKEE